MVLVEDGNIHLKVHIFLVFHLRGYLEGTGILCLYVYINLFCV